MIIRKPWINSSPQWPSLKIFNGKIFIIGVIGLALQGCSTLKYFNKPKGFYTCPSDSRVHYEAGSEVLTKIVADSLSNVMKRIEEKQGGSFARKVNIYIFADLKNYERHSPAKGSAGTTFGGNYIILSPKKANTPERITKILAHELSHLHLFGYTGIVKAVLLPSWFKEGLAVWVSGGAGAETISPAQAKQAILNGQKINILYLEPLFHSKKSHPENMQTHMFYRQSEMFVKYLYQVDRSRFEKLINLLQRRTGFEKALNSAYQKSLDALWADFVASLK